MSHPTRIGMALRRTLSGPRRHDVRKALRWDESQVSRFLTGGQGVVIDKIDALINAVGYVLAPRPCPDAGVTPGRTGVQCQCARDGSAGHRDNREYLPCAS